MSLISKEELDYLSALWDSSPNMSMLPQTKMVNKEEIPKELSDLWGTPPDLSMIWDTTDTPKLGRANASSLAKVYSILGLEKSTGRSPVTTSLGSIAKARDLLDPMKKAFAIDTPLSPDGKADPMKTLQVTIGKERPHINKGLVPYAWETKKC